VKALDIAGELIHPPNLALFARLLGHMAILRIQMRFQAPKELLARLPRVQPLSAEGCDWDRVERIARYSHWIARGLLAPSKPCLLRSLARYQLYSEMGLPVRIHFGVKPDMTRRIEGHSWLTLKGQPLCEVSPALEQYRSVYSYPAGANDFD
jgi:hypothetical protein